MLNKTSNKMSFCFSVIYISLFTLNFCLNETNISKKFKYFQDFRKRVEEVPVSLEKGSDNYNSLLSSLVNNLKEVFITTEESIHTSSTSTVLIAKIDVKTTLPDLNVHKAEKNTSKLILDKGKRASENEINSAKNIKVKKNESLTTIQDTHFNITENTDFLNLSKNLRMFQEEKEKDIQLKFVESPVFKKQQQDVGLGRSCILCNNVATMECNDPKNKLMSSIICEHKDDQCYSLHTPFKIVERGCLNINDNLTTYVCSCNLCNYISISEMPYIFSTRKDWVENIIQLSRSKHLRKSILKDMSCLSCEVNNLEMIKTMKTEDSLDTANCLEGNIATLPTQVCAENEICGVKAIRSEGYIWRGCLTSPLYNYWWTFCNTDLCNYDSLVSIHDEFHE